MSRWGSARQWSPWSSVSADTHTRGYAQTSTHLRLDRPTPPAQRRRGSRRSCTGRGSSVDRPRERRQHFPRTAAGGARAEGADPRRGGAAASPRASTPSIVARFRMPVRGSSNLGPLATSYTVAAAAPISQSVNQSINQSINQSTSQTISQSISSTERRPAFRKFDEAAVCSTCPWLAIFCRHSPDSSVGSFVSLRST